MPGGCPPARADLQTDGGLPGRAWQRGRELGSEWRDFGDSLGGLHGRCGCQWFNGGFSERDLDTSRCLVSVGSISSIGRVYKKNFPSKR